jgi:hypothetical protein
LESGNTYRKLNDAQTSNCYLTRPSQHYLSTSPDIWKPCQPSCETCSVDGTSSDHQCDTCFTAFYPKQDDTLPKNCYKDPEYYYLSASIYRRCYESCKTCSSAGNSSNHMCNTCEDNYKHLFENTSTKDC